MSNNTSNDSMLLQAWSNALDEAQFNTNTVRTRLSRVAHWAHWCSQHNQPMTDSKLDVPSFLNYVWDARPAAAYSIGANCAAFYAWAMDAGHIVRRTNPFGPGVITAYKILERKPWNITLPAGETFDEYVTHAREHLVPTYAHANIDALLRLVTTLLWRGVRPSEISALQGIVNAQAEPSEWYLEGLSGRIPVGPLTSKPSASDLTWLSRVPAHRLADALHPFVLTFAPVGAAARNELVAAATESAA